MFVPVAMVIVAEGADLVGMLPTVATENMGMGFRVLLCISSIFSSILVNLVSNAERMSLAPSASGNIRQEGRPAIAGHRCWV